MQDDMIRSCGEADLPAILAIINAAAVAYRGVIPADCWHDPYMRRNELHAEMAAGVNFMGYEEQGVLAGVMGLQRVRNVHLIRHAYVRPDRQGRGIASKLIANLQIRDGRTVLIGTWQAADWAIRFYERHGFGVVSRPATAPLLRAYWNVPERQIEASVVLASPMLTESNAAALILTA